MLAKPPVENLKKDLTPCISTQKTSLKVTQLLLDEMIFNVTVTSVVNCVTVTHNIHSFCTSTGQSDSCVVISI